MNITVFGTVFFKKNWNNVVSVIIVHDGSFKAEHVILSVTFYE